jgi:chemotaxis protein MotA
VIALIGLVVVTVSVLGGFMAGGGVLAVLFVPAEYLVIGGTALGTILISTPGSVLALTARKILSVFKRSPFKEALYLDALKMLYELFQLARREGLVAIESHIEHPEESDLFTRYPRVLAHHHAITFLCDSLRLVLVGSVPPHDLDILMDEEIDVHHQREEKPVGALQKVGDSLPGIGIVAAVLGIVITMQSIAGPIEEIGKHVASALIGTFLGILGAYGFVNPLAASIEDLNAAEMRFFYFLKAAVVAFAKGSQPLIAVEFARRAVFSDDRPSFHVMEEGCKSIGKAKAA